MSHDNAWETAVNFLSASQLHFTRNINYFRMFYKKHFVSLESDSKIFTKLMHDLRVFKSFCFVDVYNLKNDYLATLSRSVLAFILILSLCSTYEEEKEQIVEIAQKNVIWFNQIINNACDFYVILHAVCNNSEIISKSTLKLSNVLHLRKC